VLQNGIGIVISSAVLTRGERDLSRTDWIRAKARFDPVFFGLRIKDAGKKESSHDDYRV
jgi:hypothetical protein